MGGLGPRRVLQLGKFKNLQVFLLGRLRAAVASKAVIDAMYPHPTRRS